MAFIELAKKRRSVRTFAKREIPEMVLTQIRRYMADIKDPFGSSISFVILDKEKDELSSPVLSGDRLYIAAKMKKGDELGYGYAFEDLVMYLTSLGIGTVIIAGTMDRKAFEKAVHLEEDEEKPDDSARDYGSRQLMR